MNHLPPFEKCTLFASFLFFLSTLGYYMVNYNNDPYFFYPSGNTNIVLPSRTMPEPITPSQTVESPEIPTISDSLPEPTVEAIQTPSTTVVPTEKLNINTATLEELDTLPHIGPSRAADIIAYRDTLGGFTALEQLQDISGIGAVTLEEIKDLITLY